MATPKTFRGISGSISPQDGDWERVREGFRDIFSRLSAAEGRTGPTRQLADVKMAGNRIIEGPSNQRTAQEHEFITRGFLASDQAREAIRAAVPAPTTSIARSIDGGTAPTAGPTLSSGELALFTAGGVTYLVYSDPRTGSKIYFTQSGVDLF
jgi:hypothetical protein